VAELGSVNVEDLGTVGRLFGALVSKAGIPVPTEITQKVLTAAQHLAKGATYVPGFDLPKCDTLQWGQSVQSTVDRQCAHFYRLVVTEADMKNGVMVSCKSVGNDKFKVVFFDSEGHVAMVEESQKRKRHSEANLYVVPFARYNYVESMPLSLMKNLQDDVPPVFMILDTFDKDVKSLLPGTHLFCVYGDNWFQSVKYTMRALVAVPKGRDCVISIQSSEAQLALKKMDLENFQAEFCETKKKYEEACKRLEEDITKISELFDERDKSYNAYIDQSAEKYGANRPARPGSAQQPPPAAQANSSTSTGGGGGLLGGIGKLFG
jgi:hypothetical protein